MHVFQFFIICKRTNNANNATHYVKLGKTRRKNSKWNYYIISPRVIIKAVIIIIFSPTLAFACLLWFEKISFPLASNGRCSSSFSLDLHQTTQSFNLPICFYHCSCPDSDKLFHKTTVGPSSSPQNWNLGLLVQPTEREEGLTLPIRLRVSWLCWSFAVLVGWTC